MTQIANSITSYSGNQRLGDNQGSMQMRSIVIGTAGHIDHGKSSLVKALTGTDPDRLKEEKERGITTDLGFAHLALADDLQASIVDVPGHERFVKNMVAGTGGIDIVLLVIAADEGVMPQTREHLDICQLLGVKHGIVALTKIDLVDDPAWLEAVTDDLRRELEGTFLQGCPILPVSNKTRQGLDDLIRALSDMGRNLTKRSPDALAFMAIDRAFSIVGFGTVITGTLVSGTLAVDDIIDVIPDNTSRMQGLKIRGLQSHGQLTTRVSAGQRVAINLPGVERTAFRRGQVIVPSGSLAPGFTLECQMQVVLGVAALRPRSRALFHTGTAKAGAVVRLLENDQPLPGAKMFASIHCREPVAALPGQHFILRGFNAIPGRGATIGGGRILCILPPRRSKKKLDSWLTELRLLAEGSLSERLRVFLGHAQSAGMDLTDLCARSGESRALIRRELDLMLTRRQAFRFDRERGRVVAASVLSALSEKMLSLLATFHHKNPLLPGMPSEELRSKLDASLDARLYRLIADELKNQGQISSDTDKVRLPSHQVRLSNSGSKLEQGLLAAFEKSSLAPPRLDQLAADLHQTQDQVQELVRHLTRQGQLTRISNEMFVFTKALAELRQRLTAYLVERGEINTQEFKNLVGATRKHTIPLAEFFDQEKLTLRVGDKRILRNKAK